MTIITNQRYYLQIQVVTEAFIETFIEAFTEVTTDITADITVEITTEVLAKVTGGLKYYSQIQLVVPVVQAWQGLEKMS